MTFDPISIKPPTELMAERMKSIRTHCYVDYTFFARWGAARAVEALRHQMPTAGIQNRPPTEEDGDEKGQVQILDKGSWTTAHWTFVNLRYSGEFTVGEEGPGCLGPWLHTPNWRPKPEPTPQEKALALLYRVKSYPNVEGCYEFNPQELDLLIQALKPGANS